MRVLIATDSFTGTLTAGEATAAVAAGWRRAAPADELDLQPLNDGGPGFLDVIEVALGGTRRQVAVTDLQDLPVPASVLMVDTTAYVESAAACGMHLLQRPAPGVGSRSTAGVGHLVKTALDAEARRVVVGLGGTGTNDGGAGALRALGARLLDDFGAQVRPGPDGLEALVRADGSGLDGRLSGVELVAACDVDSPLTGPDGATAVFGAQKGVEPEDVPRLDAALSRLALVLERDLGAPAGLARRSGAGAAGGLGAALLAVGARPVSGAELVADLLGLPQRAAAADLLVTGEGSYDWQSLRGKVVSGAAATAGAAGIPCVVLAGRVLVGRGEMSASGVDAAYAVERPPGAASSRSAAAGLADLAARVAAQWSTGRS